MLFSNIDNIVSVMCIISLMKYIVADPKKFQEINTWMYAMFFPERR